MKKQTNSNKKKSAQLGMNNGTAAHRLRKKILFALVKNANLDKCYRCQATIKDIKDLSIEHKVPWLDSENPIELFFDLNNIAFSHVKCNRKATRINKTKRAKCGDKGATRYRDGCRCDKCTKVQIERVYEWRRKNKSLS